MKTCNWLLILLVGLLSCSKSTPDPTLEDAGATLNEQPWGGIATTWKNDSPGNPCGANTVNLSIQNKLPYPKARLQTPALCTGYCGDQRLAFVGIPASTGVYTLSTNQACLTSTNQVGVSFTTVIGGDVLRDQYRPDSTRPGTIRITKYDPQRGEIEGTFDISLFRDNSRQAASDAAEIVTFRNGVFKAKLP